MTYRASCETPRGTGFFEFSSIRSTPPVIINFSRIFPEKKKHFGGYPYGILWPWKIMETSKLPMWGSPRKTYSSVTLESREFCFEEHCAPPPLVPPPRQEEVKEECFDVRTPSRGQRGTVAPWHPLLVHDSRVATRYSLHLCIGLGDYQNPVEESF